MTGESCTTQGRLHLRPSPRSHKDLDEILIQSNVIVLICHSGIHSFFAAAVQVRSSEIFRFSDIRFGRGACAGAEDIFIEPVTHANRAAPGSHAGLLEDWSGAGWIEQYLLDWWV